jgi:NAD(P)-dependent dehydrogenase (short-subunit alcohol dehydrogenase family)
MTLAQKLRLDGQVALVTGASSGFGAHFSRVLAEAGATVAVAARRADRLTALAQSIRDGGGKAEPFALDVTDSASIEAALGAIERDLGPIRILVNNAGIAETGPFLDLTDEQWRHQMDVNFDGVLRVGRAVAKRMAARGAGGSIVNTASVAGFLVGKGLSAYAVSKAAVVHLTKAMALELAPLNIRVNALAPGYFPTELNENFLKSDAGRKMLARYPMPRAGRLEELDGPLLLLASEAGSYMTGTILTVDGGTLLLSG